MTSDRDLRYTREIKAPAAIIYRAFTQSTGLREWLCDGATVQADPGGRIVLWWNDGYVSSGEYTQLETNKEIAFTWRGKSEPQATTVQVRLQEHNGSTRLELVHSGLGDGEAWETTREEFHNGWEYGLENLKSTHETGKDLRIYNRPMLGIVLSDFNADIAAKENIPVTEGVRLDSTVEGMGAEKAGLQPGDVITTMDGHAVKSINDLANVLGAHQAGDRIEVKYCRGPEQQQIEMELSGRPVPDIPWDPAELADRVASIYSEMDAALDQALEGASEAELTAKPAPDEWSAAESIAHLLINERENNIWIGDLLGDQERWADDWGGNIDTPLKALTEAYTSTAELVAALKTREAETVALLRSLPEFTRRKASYWRVADGLLNASYHLRTHLDQIEAAIESARQ